MVNRQSPQSHGPAALDSSRPALAALGRRTNLLDMDVPELG
jgi:hypothetical protein